MKKLLLAVAVLISVHTAFSQDNAAFEKKIAASDKALADPKKSENPKTWIARAQLFQDIADAPTKGLWAGMSDMEYTLLSAQMDKPTGDENATIAGQPYAVKVFANKKIYFDDKKTVAFWDITNYAAPKPLFKANEAYQQAIKLNTDGKNSKKIAEGLDRLAIQAKAQGSNEYQLERYKEALEYFNLSLEASSNPLVGKTDSIIIYYAGVMAAVLNDNVTAEKYFRKAVEINYHREGEAHARLAEVLAANDKKEEALRFLQEGITKYPENQELLIALINNYMEAGKDPKEVLPLLHQAQKAQPENASLFFAEGQLYEKTNDFDNAIKSYEKSTQVDNKYFFGYYGLGVLYFNRGVAISDQASKVDVSNNAEFDRLMGLADEQFQHALEPFLKAHELNPSEKGAVQALKDIYFRFRNKGPEYQKNADKFKELYETM